MSPEPDAEISADAAATKRRHMTFGWWSLAAYLTLGLVLETLHGFKVDLYVAVSADTRRLMWTLAHAHGTLLSLVNIAFAVSLPSLPGLVAKPRRAASRCLLAAAVLMPLGFFLGGLFIHNGDPGLGIFLLPPGAVLLLVGVVLAARGAR